MLQVPISHGELVDKVTILKIKTEKITDAKKLANVKTELSLLTPLLTKIGMDFSSPDFIELYNINKEFWEYHDWQREQWAKMDNNDNLLNIELYRANKNEHVMNDNRAKVKKRINMTTNSLVIEEKQFIAYQI